jgi:hypothetical protein
VVRLGKIGCAAYLFLRTAGSIFSGSFDAAITMTLRSAHPSRLARNSFTSSALGDELLLGVKAAEYTSVSFGTLSVSGQDYFVALSSSME